MIIETTEKFTPEEIDEVFNIMVKSYQLYKDPSKKLGDSIKESIKNLIYGIVLLIIFLIFGFISKFNVITIIGMTLSVVLILICVLWLAVLKKNYKDKKALYEKGDHSKIIFDEQTIAVELENGSIVKLKWTEIEFIRAFDHVVGVFSSDKTRALIIPLKYWDPIAQFMSENYIIVKFFR